MMWKVTGRLGPELGHMLPGMGKGRTQTPMKSPGGTRELPHIKTNYRLTHGLTQVYLFTLYRNLTFQRS